ncbi:hypothetical protein D3C76_1599780 [compost metagenome]
MIERYKKNDYIDAIEFTNTPENHQTIIDFAGLPISIEYTSSGVQLRVIRSPYSVLIAKPGEYIVKEADGTLRVFTRATLEDEYEHVKDEEQ